MPNYLVPLIFDIRKIKAEDADMGVRSAFNLTSVDDNVTATGNNQATAYQIRAANTYVSSSPAGSGVVLPQTTGPDPLDGLTLYVTNADPANNLLCYPNPRDPNNSINGQATNTPVVLGPNTITPFITFSAISEAVAGKWIADGIGTGAAGSVETIVSQGNFATQGSSQGTAAPITQAMVNFNSIGSGVAPSTGGVLMPAKVGLQISVANNTGGSITVYASGTDTINGGSGATGVAVTNATILLFYCFTTGSWLTK